jgi:hypothetical protein
MHSLLMNLFLVVLLCGALVAGALNAKCRARFPEAVTEATRLPNNGKHASRDEKFNILCYLSCLLSSVVWPTRDVLAWTAIRSVNSLQADGCPGP